MLLNLIKHQEPDVEIIYLYVKDPFESKYELLVKAREKFGIIDIKNPKTFIDYSQTIEEVYGNAEYYNPAKKNKVVTLFRKRETKWPKN